MEDSNPFAPGTATSRGAADLWAQPGDLEPLKAERFQRWAGAFVDNLVPAVLAVPMLFLAPFLGDSEAVTDLAIVGYAMGYLLVSVVNWVLIPTRGQTLGKMAVGTRIVTDTGGPVDFVKGVVVRSWLFTFVNAMVGILSLVDVLFIFGEDKQCLHDKVAKTIVVDARAWNPYA